MKRHTPRPLYGGRFGKSLIGYVCDCCDTIYSPNMRPTGAYLSNQAPNPSRPEEREAARATIVHQSPHRAPHFHHNVPDWGRKNRKHAERVAAR